MLSLSHSWACLPTKAPSIHSSWHLHNISRCHTQVPLNKYEQERSGFLSHLGTEAEMWEIRKDCLQILRDLCYSMPSLSEQLSCDRAFVIYLFLVSSDVFSICPSSALINVKSKLASAPSIFRPPPCLPDHTSSMQLMRNSITFDDAVGLTEEILSFRGEIFSLSWIPDIEGLVG